MACYVFAEIPNNIEKYRKIPNDINIGDIKYRKTDEAVPQHNGASDDVRRASDYVV